MDELAFSDYVAARRPQLFRTACLLCGDPHRAEDIVQDALTRLYATWNRVERMNNIDGYVRRIIVNAHYSDRRRPWRREWASEPRDIPLEPGFPAEDADVIRAAVMALPAASSAHLPLPAVGSACGRELVLTVSAQYVSRTPWAALRPDRPCRRGPPCRGRRGRSSRRRCRLPGRRRCRCWC